MSDADDLDRALKAKAVLDNPLFEESFEMTRLALLAQWEKVPMADTAQAEDLRRCMKLLLSVRANLVAAVGTGKLAQFRITEEAKARKNPFKGIFR